MRLLLSKIMGINIIILKNWILHIPIDECLVKIPNDSYDILHDYFFANNNNYVFLFLPCLPIPFLYLIDIDEEGVLQLRLYFITG